MAKNKRKSIPISDIIIPAAFQQTTPNLKLVAKKCKQYQLNGHDKVFITIDSDNNLISGYAIYLALKKIGTETVEAIVQDFESVIEVKTKEKGTMLAKIPKNLMDSNIKKAIRCWCIQTAPMLFQSTLKRRLTEKRQTP